MFGCAPSPAALAAQARKIAGLVSPVITALIGTFAARSLAHLDEDEENDALLASARWYRSNRFGRRGTCVSPKSFGSLCSLAMQ